MLLIFLLSQISYNSYAQTISCGEIITGFQASNEIVPYQFTSTADYTQVYLESCGSSHDTILYLYTSSWNLIKEADDEQDHGTCSNGLSGDITIGDPSNPDLVSIGDIYGFGIGGYNGEPGNFRIELFCTGNTGPIPSPSPTPSPTPSPVSGPSTNTIQCGEIITGTRASGEIVRYDWTATTDYTSVYLEGCGSSHDIWLRVYDASGTQIAHGDDTQGHGTCSESTTGDIDIPGTISTGNQYQFGVDGYQTSSGSYRIELFCIEAAPSPSPTPSPTPSPVDVPICPNGRMRKEWSTITSAERQQYIDAFNYLASDVGGNRIQRYAEAHNAAWTQAHNEELFLPWHRAYILALEDEIRELPNYECFTLPYWDWSNELIPDDLASWQEPFILTSGLGGDPNGGCVGSPFSSYEPFGSTCLRRNVDYHTDSSCEFHQPSQLMELIDSTNNNYASWRWQLELTPHAEPHNCIGSNMASRTSPDDPIFYLHHCFVDYLWALWQDCNDFEHLSHDPDHMFNGNVNTMMTYPPLIGLDRTVESIVDISDWDQSYARGTFWDNAGVQSPGNCIGDTDTSWFPIGTEEDGKLSIISRRRLLKHGNNGNHRETSHEFERRKRHELQRRGYKGHDLNHLVSVSVCERNQELGEYGICEIPEEGTYDDCGNMENDPLTNDIDITLHQLLSKDGINECMKRTRIRYYDWAQSLNQLRALCIGCYDSFCDKPDWLKNKCATAMTPN